MGHAPLLVGGRHRRAPGVLRARPGRRVRARPDQAGEYVRVLVPRDHTSPRRKKVSAGRPQGRSGADARVRGAVGGGRAAARGRRVPAHPPGPGVFSLSNRRDDVCSVPRSSRAEAPFGPRVAQGHASRGCRPDLTRARPECAPFVTAAAQVTYQMASCAGALSQPCKRRQALRFNQCTRIDLAGKAWCDDRCDASIELAAQSQSRSKSAADCLKTHNVMG